MRCESCGLVFTDTNARDSHDPCKTCAFCLLPHSACVQACGHKYHPLCFAALEEKGKPDWLTVLEARNLWRYE